MIDGVSVCVWFRHNILRIGLCGDFACAGGWTVYMLVICNSRRRNSQEQEQEQEPHLKDSQVPDAAGRQESSVGKSGPAWIYR